MKQKFILSLMAIAFSVLSAAAQEAEQIVVNAGNVERVNIANDMDVILIPGQHTDQSVSLNAEATKTISLRLTDNSLTISPLRQISRKEKVKVYLYVNNLKTISVESNSLVKTIGVLDTPVVEVFVDNNSEVHIKTTGDVKANSLSDAEIKVKYLSDNRIAKR
jgi:hypothetical protein